MTAGLRLSGVNHFYGDHHAVRDFDLAVAAGELVCLLGPSGCGKTTTLRIAAGLEHPRTGRVEIDGAHVAGEGVDLPPEARHVGYLFQDFALFPHLDVLDNVAFGLRGLARAARGARALAMLEQVGMAAFAKSWPHQLSGGQQQRVALARALAPSPRLMLLDEPFSSLDKRLRDQIRDETLHLLKANRVATLMVTHDPEEAMFMADRVAIMRAGRIVQSGPPADLYDAPVDAFVAAFFGEVNRLPARVCNGVVTTAAGRFPAPDLGDGVAADIVIRPEAVMLTDPGGGEPQAQVVAARRLGRTSLIQLRLDDPGRPAIHLQARLAGRDLPAEGARVGLQFDLAQVFVFPDRSQDSL